MIIDSKLSKKQESIAKNTNAFIKIFGKIRENSYSPQSKLSIVNEGKEVGINFTKETSSAKSKDKPTLKVCKNCKKIYDPKLNTDTSCVYHPGHYSGRLNRINDVDTSDLEYFHSCCGEYDKDHPGCVQGMGGGGVRTRIYQCICPILQNSFLPPNA